MTRDILIDFLEREPFHDLTLTLSNNEIIEIDNPDVVRVGRNYVVLPGVEPPRRRTVTLHHVLSVESVSEPIEESH